MNTAFRGLILAGSTFALAALAGPGPALAAGPPPRAPSTVTVQNNRPVPVRVYLERGEFDIPLGTVNADQEGVLPLPRYVERDETIRFIVQPTRGMDLASQDVTLPARGTLAIFVPRNDVGYRPRARDVIPNPGPGTTTLTVRNPRDEDVEVIVEKEDVDQALGTVPPDASRTFELPSWLTAEPSEVQIFLHPRTGLDFSTSFVTLRPEAHLEVKVPR